MMGDTESVGQETAEQRLSRLRRIVGRAPQDPELRYLLARQLVDSSLVDEAIELAKSVIAMSPNHLAARKLLERALKLRSSQ